MSRNSLRHREKGKVMVQSLMKLQGVLEALSEPRVTELRVRWRLRSTAVKLARDAEILATAPYTSPIVRSTPDVADLLNVSHCCRA